jgi:hypothetical protein
MGDYQGQRFVIGNFRIGRRGCLQYSRDSRDSRSVERTSREDAREQHITFFSSQILL